MHRQERVIPYNNATSIEAERIAESKPFEYQSAIIFGRPQRIFYLRTDEGTFVKRVLIFASDAWRLVPEDPADYPEFIENYLT